MSEYVCVCRLCVCVCVFVFVCVLVCALNGYPKANALGYISTLERRVRVQHVYRYSFAYLLDTRLQHRHTRRCQRVSALIFCFEFSNWLSLERENLIGIRIGRQQPKQLLKSSALTSYLEFVLSYVPLTLLTTVYFLFFKFIRIFKTLFSTSINSNIICHIHFCKIKFI